MAVDVFWTWDIGTPGAKQKSGSLTHQAGDFVEYVREQFNSAARLTTSPDVPVTVEVFVNGAPTQIQSNMIGVAQRAVLYNSIANEHDIRGGGQGLKGSPTKAQMDAADVVQPVETDGDQGAGNVESES